MSILDLPSSSKLLDHKTIVLGNLYFFENFLVAEFNEGVNICFDNFYEAKAAIQDHFGDSDFGFIANRIHSYSITITDAPLFNDEFKNLKAYATVTYSSFAEKVFQMENHFFNFNRQNFNCLSKAIKWIEDSSENIERVI